jgi:hypothetical protein
MGSPWSSKVVPLVPSAPRVPDGKLDGDGGVKAVAGKTPSGALVPFGTLPVQWPPHVDTLHRTQQNRSRVLQRRTPRLN